MCPQLLNTDEAVELRDLYDREGLFRTTVDMNRHRFGSGEYRYLRAPYPDPIEELKQVLYPRLLRIAPGLVEPTRRPTPWPDSLDERLHMCHETGRTKSTSILLR